MLFIIILISSQKKPKLPVATAVFAEKDVATDNFKFFPRKDVATDILGSREQEHLIYWHF